MPRFVRAILFAAAAALSLIAVPVANAAVDDPGVKPVEWSRFDAGAPIGQDAERLRRILGNANRYTLVTWFPQRFGGQSRDYLDLGGTGEGAVRAPASAALALAASLQTGGYDAEVTGVPSGAARAVAVRLVRSLAHGHLSNSAGGWGDEWQSALWAYYSGYAGWMLWTDLAPEDREQVRRMVEHEADRFIGYEVPYYRDAEGNVVYRGDSKAEENAWNANLLQLATAMMPRHPREALWMEKNLELMVSAFSRPADLDSTEVVNGRRASEWLRGSNIADDGTLVNHGFIHPDYMATVLHNNNAALSYGLAGLPTPEAAFFNSDIVYDALVDLEFASPPYRPPGGTIYIDGSADMYYPQGNDWGTHRRMHVALLDAQASLYGLDALASTSGAAWGRLHGSMVLGMQSRFADGRTYGAPSEDTYSGREQWVAAHAAQAWLTHWLTYQGAVRVTGRAYPVTPRDSATGSVDVEAPRFLAPGETATVTTTLHNESQGTATDVELSLATPAGWTATPVTPATATAIPADGSFSVRWTVTAPVGARSGAVTVRASAAWRSLGRSRTAEGSDTTVVPPAPPTAPAFLSALEWIEAVNGYGPIKRDTNYYGDPLTIQDVRFDHGFWTNAPSSMSFYLGANCSRFTATVGIDDAMEAYGAARGSVVFRVFADGTKVYDSGLVRGDSSAPPVDLDVTGIEELRLVATDGGVDGKSYDHADWGDPYVVCG